MAVHTRDNPPAGMEALAERIRNEDAEGEAFLKRIQRHPQARAVFEYLASLEDRIETLEQRVSSLPAANWPADGR
jgi:hypothetical protein